jgi:hypothetical protein
MILQDEIDEQRKKVDVEHFDLSIREIARMVTESEMQIAPEYQRKFRWSEETESRLIESVFLGLPIPTIFVASNRDGTWEVIDGLQRISTIIHYVSTDPIHLDIIGKKASLTLINLEKVSSLNGTQFANIPNNIQLLFWKKSLRITVLSDKSDYDARFEMFERLNTGGVALSPQEVRSCVFRGPAIEFIEECSVYANFTKLLKLQSKRQNDGTAAEIVLKFFSYLYNRSSFDGRVTAFLNDFLRHNGQKLRTKKNETLFHAACDHAVKATRGKPLLRKNVSTTPLNQLEAVLVGIAELVRDNKPLKTPAAGWQDDQQLVESSTGATNTLKSLGARIDRASQLFS